MEQENRINNINSNANDEKIKEEYRKASEQILSIMKKYKKDNVSTEDKER